MIVGELIIICVWILGVISGIGMILFFTKIVESEYYFLLFPMIILFALSVALSIKFIILNVDWVILIEWWGSEL